MPGNHGPRWADAKRNTAAILEITDSLTRHNPDNTFDCIMIHAVNEISQAAAAIADLPTTLAQLARLKAINRELVAVIDECEKVLFARFATSMTPDGREAVKLVNHLRDALTKSQEVK
jgi:hypothetical protein